MSKKNILNQTPLSITSRRVSMSITILDLKFINLKLVHFFFHKSAFLRFTQILRDTVPNLDPKAAESVGDWMLYF